MSIVVYCKRKMYNYGTGDGIRGKDVIEFHCRDRSPCTCNGHYSGQVPGGRQLLWEPIASGIDGREREMGNNLVS